MEGERIQHEERESEQAPGSTVSLPLALLAMVVLLAIVVVLMSGPAEQLGVGSVNVTIRP